MERPTGPYTVLSEVNFAPNGDTTNQAFQKHMDDINRIYGLLTAFDKDVANTESNSSALQTHINSINPHPYWTPSISWGNVTGKPSNLLTANDTIDASKVSGFFTSNKISDFSTAVQALIPAGNGITNSKFAQDGYVQFANGLIIQWDRVLKTSETTNFTVSVTFNKPFTVMCFGVAPIIESYTAAYSYSLYGAVTRTGFSLKLPGTQGGSGTIIIPSDVTIAYIAIG